MFLVGSNRSLRKILDLASKRFQLMARKFRLGRQNWFFRALSNILTKKKIKCMIVNGYNAESNSSFVEKTSAWFSNLRFMRPEKHFVVNTFVNFKIFRIHFQIFANRFHNFGELTSGGLSNCFVRLPGNVLGKIIILGKSCFQKCFRIRRKSCLRFCQDLLTELLNVPFTFPKQHFEANKVC